MEACLEFITPTLPCRENIIKQLYSYIGYADEVFPECLFLLGHKGTGKSKTVTALLNYLSYPNAILNCIECYSLRLMLENILNKLSGHELNLENNYNSFCKCDSMADFLPGMKKISQIKPNNSYIIVLENAERLRDMDHNVLPAFMRLRELTSLNICTILISDITYEKFYNKTGLSDPIIIQVPQYSKEELMKIMVLDFNYNKNLLMKKFSLHVETDSGILDSLGENFYLSYLNVFLHVFYRACRDLPELQHMARVCYMEYCRPVISGNIKAEDMTKLWRHIAPILKSALGTLYQRIGVQDIIENNTIDKFDIDLHTEKSDNVLQTIELPHYAKYLLIAAYLASYNAAKEDKRLFMQHHGKRRKRVQDLKKKAKVTEKLSTQIGPKTFTLDRLLAIFYAILEERVGLTCNLLAQISSLVQLQMLVCTGGEISIDSAHYQCAVGLDFIQTVAKSVGFNIRKYLYDFI